jgi:hypothetical protein
MKMHFRNSSNMSKDKKNSNKVSFNLNDFTINTK